MVSGCLQVGPGRLEILSRSTYPDGSPRMHYRIVGDVLPYWGAHPVPGSEYVYQEGIGPRTETEIREAFSWALNETNLMSYRGPHETYPYRQVAS